MSTPEITSPEREKARYYVVEKKALPEILLKVIKAKQLLNTQYGITIQEAVREVGISRSSFYKYKDVIFEFHDNVRGQTVVFMVIMDDIPGILSDVLKEVAKYRASILTIHQTIPINAMATLTMSIDIPPDTCDVDAMMRDIEELKGVHQLKILGKE